jgi:hypothetical protein
VVRKNQKQIAEMACNDSTVKVMRDKKWKEVLVEKTTKKRQNHQNLMQKTVLKLQKSQIFL